MNSIRVCIVEDEGPAARRLQRLLVDCPIKVETVLLLTSVKECLNQLAFRNDIDLCLMDIQLGDGISLEILDKTELRLPIIFTTAFGEYTLKALKHYCIDYLLKPVDADELYAAIEKYVKVYKNLHTSTLPNKTIAYKERFLVKSGNHLRVIKRSEISYFYSDGGYTHLVCDHGKRYFMDETLDNVNRLVDPQSFFRINRYMIVNHQAIDKIETYFNSRFTLTLIPNFHETVIVSRERCKDFKDWIDR